MIVLQYKTINPKFSQREILAQKHVFGCHKCRPTVLEHAISKELSQYRHTDFWFNIYKYPHQVKSLYGTYNLHLLNYGGLDMLSFILLL